MISKTELINFLKDLNLKNIKNINELKLPDTISKILKNTNNMKILTNMINTNKDLSKYNNWNVLIEKKILITLDIRFIIPLNVENYIQIQKNILKKQMEKCILILMENNLQD